MEKEKPKKQAASDLYEVKLCSKMLSQWTEVMKQEKRRRYGLMMKAVVFHRRLVGFLFMENKSSALYSGYYCGNISSCGWNIIWWRILSKKLPRISSFSGLKSISSSRIMFLEEKIEEDYVNLGNYIISFMVRCIRYILDICMYIFMNDNIFSTSINKYQCIVRKYI